MAFKLPRACRAKEVQIRNSHIGLALVQKEHFVAPSQPPVKLNRLLHLVDWTIAHHSRQKNDRMIPRTRTYCQCTAFLQEAPWAMGQRVT